MSTTEYVSCANCKRFIPKIYQYQKTDHYAVDDYTREYFDCDVIDGEKVCHECTAKLVAHRGIVGANK